MGPIGDWILVCAMDPRLLWFYQQQEMPLKKDGDMKITLDVDCTPEEARRFMGLPDLTGVHELYLDKLKRSIDEGIGPETIETMVRAWAPMGEAGMTIWRQMIDQMSGGGSAKK